MTYAQRTFTTSTVEMVGKRFGLIIKSLEVEKKRNTEEIHLSKFLINDIDNSID
tara:strand:+ start:1040 stop:1201 length:162 start_codon:yes stop_codon:yes gene_type:complete